MNPFTLITASLARRLMAGFVLVLALSAGSTWVYQQRVVEMRDSIVTMLRTSKLGNQTADFGLSMNNLRGDVLNYMRTEKASDAVGVQRGFSAVSGELKRLVGAGAPAAGKIAPFLDAYRAGEEKIAGTISAKQGASTTILAQGGAAAGIFQTIAAATAGQNAEMFPLALRALASTGALSAAANRFYATGRSSDLEIVLAEKTRLLADAADLRAGLAGDPLAALATAGEAHAKQLIAAADALAAAWKVLDADTASTAEAGTGALRQTSAVLTEMNQHEENVAAGTIATADRAQVVGLTAMAGALVVGLIAAVLLGRGLSRSIARITTTMSALAEGDLTIAVSDTHRRDEVGAMARAVEIFKRNALRMKEIEAENSQQEARAAAARRASLHDMADRLEAEVKQIAGTVASAAESLNANATAMAGSVRATAERSHDAAQGADSAASQVQLVAAAAEQLAASINEISSQVNECTHVTETGIAQADATGTAMGKLNAAAEEISQVAALVEAIARQTNLLALNATIEAARAGEAGKGFAVVASEVKNLASQTSKATEDIARRVSAIQQETSAARQVISAVASTINRIGQATASIAAAVTEQSAATGEISRSVQHVATGTQEATRNIAEVLDANTGAAAQAQEVQTNAGEVRQQAADLQTSLDHFLTGLRAA